MGSHNYCLWGMFDSAQGSYVGGCSFGGSSQFNMYWNGQPVGFVSRGASNSSVGTLYLIYNDTAADGTAGQQRSSIGAAGTLVEVSFTFNASIGFGASTNKYKNSPAPWFGASLRVHSAPDGVSPSSPLTTLAFPSELLFPGNSTAGATIPFLPGARLRRGFFDRLLQGSGSVSGSNPQEQVLESEQGEGGAIPRWTLDYPGRGCFADFWHTAIDSPSSDSNQLTVDEDPSSGGPGMAVFGVAGPREVQPASFGPVRASTPDAWFLGRTMPINLTRSGPVSGFRPMTVPGMLGGSGRAGAAGTAGMPESPWINTGICIGDYAGCLESMAQANGLRDEEAYPPLPARFESSPYPADKKTQRPVQRPALAEWLKAPLMKADALALGGIPFSQYGEKVLPKLPSPCILHLAAYEPHGFDRWYPDMIPPAQQLGSTCDFRNMQQLANSQFGLITMPYTNPTWLDPLAPTLQSLPQHGLTLSDVCALNGTLQPFVESYGPNSGVVSEPRHPFISSRMHELVLQMTANGTSTEEGIPAGGLDQCGGVDSDMLFEDQISARPPIPDRHPLAREAPLHGCPGQALLGPISGANNEHALAPSSETCWFFGGGPGYLDGWRLHVANHSDSPPLAALSVAGDEGGRSILLHSEQGFDRLIGRGGVASSWGAILGAYQNGQTASWFGADSMDVWQPVPLAEQLLRGAAVFSQHDLSMTTFSIDTDQLAWAVGMGMHTSLSSAYKFDQGWADGVADLQRLVLSRYACDRVVSFDFLQGTAVRPDEESGPASSSLFPLWKLGLETATVIRNQDSGAAHVVQLDTDYSNVTLEYGLAESGFGLQWARPGPGARHPVLACLEEVEAADGPGNGGSLFAPGRRSVGLWAEGKAGSAVAGAFQERYGGGQLSAGSHVLIELRGVACGSSASSSSSAAAAASYARSTPGKGFLSSPMCILVLQPSGNSTSLRVAWDPSWPTGGATTTTMVVVATPVGRDGSPVGPGHDASLEPPQGNYPGFATFQWNEAVAAPGGGEQAGRPWGYLLSVA